MARYNVNQDGSQNCTETKIHYAVLHSELSGEVSEELVKTEKFKYSKDVDKLARAIDLLQKDNDIFKKNHELRIENAKKKYNDNVEKLKKITNKLMNSNDNSEKNIKEFYKTLKGMAQERQGLLQIIENRRTEQKRIEELLREAKDPNKLVNDQPLTSEELNEFHQREEKLKMFISNMRLEMARLNREVLRYTTAIDEIPGAAELLQYEKRFIELYNQVASKHRETKQYYIFYNTLYEMKLYLSKELSLLNSILDNYDEAMSSARSREEFMTQFESIVDWVNQTVKKVEEKYRVEKEKKSSLHNEYSHLLDIQRQYAAALKKLAEERQKINRQRHN